MNVIALQDEVHLGSILGSQVVEPTRAEILQTLPKLNANPLFE